jgi:hypothetical protein
MLAVHVKMVMIGWYVPPSQDKMSVLPATGDFMLVSACNTLPAQAPLLHVEDAWWQHGARWRAHCIVPGPDPPAGPHGSKPGVLGAALGQGNITNISSSISVDGGRFIVLLCAVLLYTHNVPAAARWTYQVFYMCCCTMHNNACAVCR